MLAIFRQTQPSVVKPEIVNRVMLPTWDALCQWQAKALNYLIDENGYQVVFSHIHNVDAMGHMFWYYGKNRPVMDKWKKKAIRLQLKMYICKLTVIWANLYIIWTKVDHYDLLRPWLADTEEEEKPLIGDAFRLQRKSNAGTGLHHSEKR